MKMKVMFKSAKARALILVLSLFSLQIANAQSNDCSSNCQMTWQDVFSFPAIAETHGGGVYKYANEIYVSAISGSGQVRELVLNLADGSTRYITEVYKLMSQGGQGVTVNLGDTLNVVSMRIKADSWGGRGTQVEFQVQLRKRTQSSQPQPSERTVSILPGQDVIINPMKSSIRVHCEQ